MKLKDYEMPRYGLDGQDPEDLAQYSLKNFDLKAYQLSQQSLDPAPLPAPCAPSLLEHETDRPVPVAAAPVAPSPIPLDPDPWTSPPEPPDAQSFGHAPNPVQPEPSQRPLDAYDVQFGAHFNLQTVAYTPLSPAQSWKIPRWVVATVGLFFGSAAVLTLACCVVLLRDPKPAPTEPAAAPPAPVATASAAPAPSASSSPTNKAPVDATRVASAPAVRHSGPATTNLMHDDSAPGRRIVVSRHPNVVRRQIYRSRRVASKSTDSSVEPQPTETASRRPPPDDLDKLLGESSL